MRRAAGRRWLLAALLCGACRTEGDARSVEEPGEADAGAQDNGGADAAGASATQPLPLVVGNIWSYRVTDEGQPPFIKTQTVEAREAVGGLGPAAALVAFRLVTTRRAGTSAEERTVSWQAWDGARLLRHRELAFPPGSPPAAPPTTDTFWVPGRLRLDAQPLGRELGAKALWTELFTEHVIEPALGAVPRPCEPPSCERIEEWEVLGEDDCGLSSPPTINGGRRPTLRCAHVRRADGAESDRHYWFAAGVGKVREVGQRTMEELVGATLVGGSGGR